MPVKIDNVRIFDGEHVLDQRSVTFDDGLITAVGEDSTDGASVIDGSGSTLLPGLIDAHVHTDLDLLRLALTFGITTELEMLGHWTAEQRREIADRDDLADLRTAELGVTDPDGHPHALHREIAKRKGAENEAPRASFGVSSPEEAVAFVAAQVQAGADYVKILIEDGAAIGQDGTEPVPSDETYLAAVHEAHRHHRMVVAHVTTGERAQQAVDLGVDGLAHLWFDETPPGLVTALVERGVFVISTLVTYKLFEGVSNHDFGADPRVAARLGADWFTDDTFTFLPHRDLGQALANLTELHRAGVRILAGTDAAPPLAGGLAHGASLHQELQLLVDGGLTPIEALVAATSRPAEIFDLADRGRIVSGARADLLLVDGDPTTTISDTLSTRAVWRRGTPVDLPAGITDRPATNGSAR